MIDLVKALRNRATWETATGITEPHQHIDWMAAEEITRLREEIARYKLTYAEYVEAIDRMNGTPCEQIRHQQEVDALREENARLRAVIQFILDNQISERRSEHIDCVIIHGEPIRAARVAIREGGKDDAA